MTAFNEGSRPTLPGVYFRFDGSVRAVVPPSIGNTVAISGTHDWGPVEVPTLCTSLSDFESKFGDTYSPLYVAVNQAFRGEDIDGIYGAGAVIVYRMVGASGAKGARVLQNTTPATALTLTAKYEGVRANALKITVQDKAGDSTKTELIVLDGTTEVERYEFLDADINDAAAQINAHSKWFTAVANISGVALTVVSAQAVTGGNDGATLVAGDYTTMMSGLEQSRFAFLADANLTDTAIVASLKTWAENLNVNGRKFITVLGGALAETVATAITRAGTLNSENFLTIGAGSYADDRLLDASGNPTALSTAQLAPRIAGILAQRGENGSATYARLNGLRITAGVTQSSLKTAYDAGVTLIGQDSDVEAPVHLESVVTTYTTKTNVDKPYDIFKRPKNIRTMGGIEIDLTDYVARRMIGRLTINDKTRDAVVGKAQEFLRGREAVGAIQPEWTCIPNPNSSDDDEFVEVLIGLKFGRSLEQVYFITRIG